MTKTLVCKNMGHPTCDFVATASTDDEVVDMMMEHHETMHPDDLIRVSEGNMRAKMEAQIEEM